MVMDEIDTCISLRTSRRAKKYTDRSFYFSVIEAFLSKRQYDDSLRKLVIKSEETRFRLLWTMK